MRMHLDKEPGTDITIIGAGVIGLAIASVITAI